MCNYTCARIFLFIFNVVFFITGAAVLALGIWIKVDPTIVNYLLVVNISQTDPLLGHAASVLIGVGAFSFIVGFLGCVGALRKSQLLLFLYATLLLIVMVAEIAAAVMALVYRSKIQTHLLEAMEKQIKQDYKVDTSTFVAWNSLHEDLKCCGANNYTDFASSEWKKNTTKTVPESCCMPKDSVECQTDASMGKTSSEFLRTKGCHESMNRWFQRHSLYFVAVGFFVAFIQIFGFVAACCLRNAIKKTKYETEN